MRRNSTVSVVAALAASLVVGSFASASTVIFDTGVPVSSFTPFNSSNAATRKIGDSGWITAGGSAPVSGLNSITLGLATFSPVGVETPAGTADIKFTLNDGDPSGLVFGPGTVLYSTTITGVELPASSEGFASFFDLTIPLPGITLSGGFNNVGWSVGVENFNYGGNFGAQTTGTPNAVGFFTNVASEFDGPLQPGGWATYTFGAPANFRAIITVPEPTTLGALAMLGAVTLRRRGR